MNFDFPEPYDLEVPRRIGEARKELTPAGEEVLERLLAALANPGVQKPRSPSPLQWHRYNPLSSVYCTA
jgi:hypothetical protein